MILRPLLPEDADDAVEVWRAAQAARGMRPSAARTARVAEKCLDELGVVADDGEVVAMALGEPHRDDPAVLHVSMVFVHPDRQREGIGSALLEALADEAWEQGFRHLSVWSRTPAFYEACGLERTGDVDGDAVRLTAELEAPVEELEVGAEGIRLGQLLKLAEVVETGAEAKELLAEGVVEVNDEVETRRGRQLADGDTVRARDRAIRLVLGAAD